MNRKSFLKTLGIGVAGAAIIPAIPKPPIKKAEIPKPSTLTISGVHPGDILMYHNNDGELTYCIVSSVNRETSEANIYNIDPEHYKEHTAISNLSSYYKISSARSMG